MSSSEKLSLQVMTMSGKVAEISTLKPTDTLNDLLMMAVESLELSGTMGQTTLCLDSRRFSSRDKDAMLSDLEIEDGSVLLCVCQNCLFDVGEGTRVQVNEAGDEEMNGTYTAISQSGPGGNGRIRFQHDSNSDFCINWCPKRSVSGKTRSSEWPAGWYLQKGMYGVYFECSYLADCLPLSGWDPYSGGAFARPGPMPGPSIVVVTG